MVNGRLAGTKPLQEGRRRRLRDQRWFRNHRWRDVADGTTDFSVLPSQLRGPVRLGTRQTGVILLE